MSLAGGHVHQVAPGEESFWVFYGIFIEITPSTNVFQISKFIFDTLLWA
jgi:hypothetical protein